MLTAFCDLAFVSNHSTPSMTANHIATTCGWPVDPSDTNVAVRRAITNAQISSAVISICARRLVPTGSPFPVTATGPRKRAGENGSHDVDKVGDDLISAPGGRVLAQQAPGAFDVAQDVQSHVHRLSQAEVECRGRDARAQPPQKLDERSVAPEGRT